MSRKRKFLLLLPLVLLGGSPATMGAFPEPDVLIWGLLNGNSPEGLTVHWPTGSATAEALPDGYFVMRVPVDSATEDSGGERPEAAHFGHTLELRLGGETLAQTEPLSRGHLVRLDLPPVGSELFRRGDANDNGAADISDAIFSLSFLFLGGDRPPCLDAADANDDNTVDITDAIFLLGYLFLGGPPPPPPGSSVCGADLTADNLSLCVQSTCSAAPRTNGKSQDLAEGQEGGNKSRDAQGGPKGGGGAVRAPPSLPLGALVRPVTGEPRAGLLDAELQLLGLLEVVPATLDFGAVSVGGMNVKTLLIRNHSPSPIVLEQLEETPPDYAVLHHRCVIPPGMEIRWGVLFRPGAVGSLYGTLQLAPGVAVALAGEGWDGPPAAGIDDLLVAPAHWQAGAEFAVAVRFADFLAGSRLDFAISYPADQLRIEGMEYGANCVPWEPRPASSAIPGVFEGGVELSEVGSSFEVRLVVSPVESSALKTPMSLSWSRLMLHPPEAHGAEVGTASDGDEAETLVELAGTHGEIVVTRASLDLDDDAQLRVSSDLVYAERAREGLPPVPATFSALAPADSEAVGVLHALFSELTPWVTGPAENRVGSGDHFAELSGRLLGCSPSRSLGLLAEARLAYATQPYCPPLFAGAVRTPGESVVVELNSSAIDSREGTVPLLVSTPKSVSSLVLTFELGAGSDVLTVEAAATLPGLVARVGRGAHNPRLRRVLLLDPLGEVWIPPGSLAVGSAGVRVRHPERRLLAAGVSLRLVEVSAAQGPLVVAARASGAPCYLPALGGTEALPELAVQVGDCNADGLVDVRDALYLARFLVGKGPEPLHPRPCDQDADGDLDLADLLRSVTNLMER